MVYERKRILLLGTGGTIASEEGPNGMASKLKIEQIIQPIMPKLTGLCEIITEDILTLDSTNIQPEEWEKMAKKTFEGLKTYDGVVITHGTDTMAYTSSMLSFMLKNLDKPVILTGSQIPICKAGTDVYNNILDAVRVAIERYPGVYIVFDGKIIKGTKASKVHTTELRAFESINDPFAGEIIGEEVKMYYPLHRGTKRLELDDTISTDVFLLKLIPGISPAVVNQLVDMRYRGIVIEAFGLGGLTNVRRNLIKPIRNAIKADVAVVVMTQCRYGITDLTVYEVGKNALGIGVIPVSNMTVEAAVTKLMWVLGHTDNLIETSKEMKENICGEMNNCCGLRNGSAQ